MVCLCGSLGADEMDLYAHQAQGRIILLGLVPDLSPEDLEVLVLERLDRRSLGPPWVQNHDTIVPSSAEGFVVEYFEPQIARVALEGCGILLLHERERAAATGALGQKGSR